MTGPAAGAERCDVASLGRIVGVWAHPDDETYLSGGLMAAAVDNGQFVACVTATAGEHGTTDPQRWPPGRLAATRRAELRASLDVLGVHDLSWLGIEDGRCPTIPVDDAVDRVLAELHRYQPDTIVTFGADGFTGHPDHQAVNRWVTAAADAHGDVRVLHAAKTTDWAADFHPIHRRFPIFGPGYPQPVDVADLALELALDDASLARKLAALLVQHSQTGPIIEALGCDDWRAWVRTESFVQALAPVPEAALAG